MTETPKEIWVNRYSSAITTYNPAFVSAEKYIHEDESKAREEAAHKRGMEEAAKLAEETATCLLPRGHFLSERVAAAIRAKIDNA